MTTSTAYGLPTSDAIDAEVAARGIRGCTPRNSRLNEYNSRKCRCDACKAACALYEAARRTLARERRMAIQNRQAAS